MTICSIKKTKTVYYKKKVSWKFWITLYIVARMRNVNKNILRYFPSIKQLCLYREPHLVKLNQRIKKYYFRVYCNIRTEVPWHTR
jgi:hypothetical protein